MADYEFDIFISYRNLEGVREWVWTTFHNELLRKLNSRLRKKPKVFIDYHDVEKSDFWSERIVDALHRSKVLLAILDCAYEASHWCRAEFACIEARERHLKRYKVPGQGLVVPIAYIDPTELSDELRSRKLFEFHRFAYADEPFRRSKKYLKFQDKMTELAAIIVKRLEDQTPQWDDSWPKLLPPANLQPNPLAVVGKPKL